MATTLQTDMRRIKAALVLLLISVCFNVAAQRAPVPAQVTFAGAGVGSVGYVTVSGSSTVNAEIGRWDTPYPYPDTGEYAPGLQPTGFSTLNIDVDVNDGGVVTFRYFTQSYDAGIYDWFDIVMETPSGSIPIISRLGKPGTAYGTYWASPNIPIVQELDQWRNQRVRFVFRIMQDGWGDQTQGKIINFKVSTCSVAPLTAVTDSDASNFEAGNTIDTSRLTTKTLNGLNCLQAATVSSGGTFKLTSAYRPVAYQAHLREVWDSWKAIKNRTDIECANLKLEIGAEFIKHALLETQRPAVASPHATGIAFDATLSGLPSGTTRDSLAASCGLVRPWPVNDPPHYQPL